MGASGWPVPMLVPTVIDAAECLAVQEVPVARCISPAAAVSAWMPSGGVQELAGQFLGRG